MDHVYSVNKQVSVERNYNKVVEMHKELPEEFKQWMKDSKVRYKCTKDGIEVAVMYLLENEYKTKAVCMYADDVVGLMHIFKRLWDDTVVRKIEVVPHNRQEMLQMISMATGDSIRAYNANQTNKLMIDVERLKMKMEGWVVRCQ
jgi:hypothetical protein